MGFPDGLDGKEAFCNARDLGLIFGSGRSLAEGNGHPLQCSCLENPMDRGAWRATVHGVAESDMTEQLTVIWDQHPTFSHPPVHREWQELYHRQDSQDPGLPGGAGGREPACQYRRHKRRGSNPCVGKTPWRRAWHPTPVFLPGESHGQRSLEAYSP